MTKKKDDRETVYKPDAVPTHITRRLHIGYGIGRYNAGRVVVDDHDMHSQPGSENSDFAVIPLKELNLKLDLPKMKIDVKARMIEVLEAQKKKVMAESQREIMRIDDEIQKLLQIEYKAKGK